MEKITNRNGGEVSDKYPQAVLYQFVDNYFVHGEGVAKTMEQAWKKEGLKSTGVEMIPLQSIFDHESVHLITDDLGNPGVSLYFDPDKIIDLLKDNPNDIINGSFQIGHVEAFLEKRIKEIPNADIPRAMYEQNSNLEDINKDKVYISTDRKISTWNYHSNQDGIVIPIGYDYETQKEVPLTIVTKAEYDALVQDAHAKAERNAIIRDSTGPGLKIIGANIKEKAEENLLNYFKICNAYPEKTFVFALGNEGEDIREAVKLLRGSFPENLRFAAEWHPLGSPVNDVYGATTYVNNRELKNSYGSTHSTAAISAVEAALKEKGLGPEERKAEIEAGSEEQRYKDNQGNENVARLFNPDLFDN